MRSIRTTALALVAVFALAAAAAASASAAEPTYMTCAKASKVGKAYTGKYSDKLCSTESATSTGKYERVALSGPIAFKAKGGEATLTLYNPLESKVEIEVPCAKSSDTGSIINGRESTLTIKYEGCVIPPGRKLVGNCTGAGQKQGTVVTEELTSTLVWTNEGETEVGALIQPKSGTTIEKFSCAGEAESVESNGMFVGKMSPANSASKAPTLTVISSKTTGAPELAGSWEGGLFQAATLTASLSGAVVHPAVPFSNGLVLAQKVKPEVVIAG